VKITTRSTRDADTGDELITASTPYDDSITRECGYSFGAPLPFHYAVAEELAGGQLVCWGKTRNGYVFETEG
jgi:hypothetical protein